MAEGLFRTEAIASSQNPDARGGLLLAAPPSGFVPVAIVVGAFAAAVVAAIVVRVEVTTEGRGIVRPEAGSLVVRAPRAGTVTDLRVRAGETIAASAVVARIGDAPVTTAAGTVDYVDVHAGDFVPEGAPLLEIVPTADPLVGFMAVPAADRERVAPGTRVRLRIDGRGSDADATETTIDRIGAQVLSDARARAIFGAEAPREPSFLAVLRMPPGLRNGTIFTGSVTVERPTILELVFGRRRR